MAERRSYVKMMATLVPNVLRGPWGEKLMGAMALLSDAMTQGSFDAILASFPVSTPTIAPDALPYAGAEVGMARYATETDAQYQARIARAWPDYQRAGTRQTIIAQLEAAGYPGAVIDSKAEAEGWAYAVAVREFRVTFPLGTHWVTSAGPTFGSFTFGDGTRFGAYPMTTAQIVTMRAIIKKWKPANWACSEIRFELPGGVYARIGAA